MRFKIDENLPTEIAEVLQQAGHDASTVLEQHLGGSADDQLAALCQLESRILVTLDMDFADIRSYPPAGFPGLIVLRLRKQDKPYHHANPDQCPRAHPGFMAGKLPVSRLAPLRRYAIRRNS